MLSFVVSDFLSPLSLSDHIVGFFFVFNVSETADRLEGPSASHRVTCHELLRFQLQGNPCGKWLVTRLRCENKAEDRREGEVKIAQGHPCSLQMP